MYLSQLVLNSRSRIVLNDLSDPYELHRTIMSGFPEVLPEGERILFRVEIQNSEPVLSVLVQSRTPPDWSGLEQRGYLRRSAAVKTFEFQPEIGQTYIFRLAANPTKRLKGDGEKDGPRVGLQKEEDQLDWLRRKGEQNGFSVLSARASRQDRPDGVKYIQGKKNHIRCLVICFNGLLTVTDPMAFRQACMQGVGSAKGLGCGLLSLAKAG